MNGIHMYLAIALVVLFYYIDAIKKGETAKKYPALAVGSVLVALALAWPLSLAVFAAAMLIERK